MAYSHYDRLTALDTTFLAVEDPNVHMHVGSVALFEAGPLRGPHGSLDIDKIYAMSESTLRYYPRFRQKLAWVPLLNHPVWVDDDRFNLHYHLRHTSLPAPGNVRLLKRLAGRIMSQKLDRGKPLWEIWFVDSVAGDKVAIITKAHHCMIDGISSVDLMSAFMRFDSNPSVGVAKPWIPRPAPRPRELLRDELLRRASLPLTSANAVRRVLADPRRAGSTLWDTVEGLREAVVAGIVPASPTPLNLDIGPHRRFDWTRFELDEVKEVKRRLGGTLNDVVLAVVSGAMRRFLRARGERVDELDFRSMVPVNVRTSAEHGTLGNRVSFLLARLPLEERDPRRRLQKVIEATQKLKHSKQVVGAEALEEISDRTFDSLFVQYARLAARSRAYNMVVTNVPGPQMPVYLLGARMREVYPLVPLFVNQAIGIALFSYDGGLFWGFNSDWDAVPDLHELVEAIEREFSLLREAAAPVKAETRPAPQGRRVAARHRPVKTPARGRKGKVARAARR
jgi:diacylglycerol O-acyltransferase